MAIHVFLDGGTLYHPVFKLDAAESSYVFGVGKSGLLTHLYYGDPLSDGEVPALLLRESRASCRGKEDAELPPDRAAFEYPASGRSGLRPAAFSVLYGDGDNVAELLYSSYRIIPGKPGIRGLPHTYSESDKKAETLCVTLKDPVKNLRVELFYSVFQGLNAVSRWAEVKNEGVSSVTLKKVMSASLSLPDLDRDFIHLHGAWGGEFLPEKVPCSHCTQSVSSFLGASGAEHNPFAAFASRGCTETAGEVYGISLVYSGNFVIESDGDFCDRLRVNAGINPRAFSWRLEPGETFEAPEAVLVRSGRGLGEMSRTYHDLYRRHLCRGRWRDLPRPALLNTWEAVYFKFNRDRLMELAKSAAQLGIELFVLDDGWFGHRDDDTSSLGDWYVNEKKLGCTLKELTEDVNRLGLKFGIWVEPEMISPDSDLYRSHPEWALRQPGRSATLERSQLILDLSRPEVRKYIVERMTDIFGSGNISYVKWDMNRNMSEIGSSYLPADRVGELPHRYMLGLYEIMDTLTRRFPGILFESCASGGGRFDPGMLYYMPQIWTSDNTDAVQRLTTQYGASFVYPPAVMGCHVSDVPNQQIGRVTPIETRAAVAMAGGGFGYELDPGKLSPEDREAVKKQVAQYKKYRFLYQEGDLYRLASPVESNEPAFMVVSKDKKHAAVSCFRILCGVANGVTAIKLQGLEKGWNYRDPETGSVFSGSLLMKAGLKLPAAKGDFRSLRIFLEKV